MTPHQVSQLTVGQRVIIVLERDRLAIPYSGTVKRGTLTEIRDFGALVHIDGTPEFINMFMWPAAIHIDETHADREISLEIQEVHCSRDIEDTSDDRLECDLESMRATIYLSSRERLAAEAARAMSAT